MDIGDPGAGTTLLSYGNVALAFSFILFDAVISSTFGLGVGSSLVTAAIRCVIQLSVVALVLKKVFEANNPWAVAGIACASSFIFRSSFILTQSFLQGLLNIMGTTETGMKLRLPDKRMLNPSCDSYQQVEETIRPYGEHMLIEWPLSFILKTIRLVPCCTYWDDWVYNPRLYNRYSLCNVHRPILAARAV